MRSGFATFSPKEQPKRRSTGTEADSYHYARVRPLAAVPENVEVAMFAIDALLFSSHPNKEVTEAAIQEAITNVAGWSRLQKLTINASKCELERGPLAALVTVRWVPPQHNLTTKVPRSYHR